MLHLQKLGMKEMPFKGNTVLKFQVGMLLNENNLAQFRYTRSLAKVRSFYRVTLQYSADESYTPYVFDIIRSAEGQLVIEPDNDEARKSWLVPANPRTIQLKEALNLIYQEDIEHA